MDELKGMLIKLLLDYYEHGKNLDTIAIDDDIKPILKYRDQLVSRVELPVMPKYTDTWQLCPKCNGQGTVSKPPYVQGDQNQWTTSASSFICDVCNGTKIIKR